MEWLAVSIAFVATIYFAIHYRGFRRGLMYAVGGVTALAAVAAIVVAYHNHQLEKRRQIASTLIRPGQIEISDAKLALGSLPKLSGAVINRSEHELAELAIKITVSDCPRTVRPNNTNIEVEGPDGTIHEFPPGTSPDVIKSVMKKRYGGESAAQRPPQEHGPWERYRAQSGRQDPWAEFRPVAPDQQNAQCGVVGESVERVYSINVPSGQKRAFEEYVTTPKLPEMKEWSWHYTIEEAIAKY